MVTPFSVTVAPAAMEIFTLLPNVPLNISPSLAV